MRGFEFFRNRESYGVVFMRFIIGVFVIYGVQDNVLSNDRMEEFAGFLSQRNVPFPLFSAYLSVYVQLLCGISILLGAWIRLFSVLLIINFIAAIIIAHLGDTFQGMFPALVILFSGFLFLFNGAGPLSVDRLLERRKDIQNH